MTALLFGLQEDSVIVAMDTKSHNQDTYETNIEDKFYYFDDSKIIMCGTGSAWIKKKWHESINELNVHKSITLLNFLATKRLLSISNELDKIYNKFIDVTIYQFGYDEAKERFRGFLYSKENNFKSEELTCGCTSIVPPIGEDILNEITRRESTDPFKFFSEIMREQKKQDDLKALKDRAIIGGKIKILAITKNNFLIKEFDF